MKQEHIEGKGINIQELSGNFITGINPLTIKKLDINKSKSAKQRVIEVYKQSEIDYKAEAFRKRIRQRSKEPHEIRTVSSNRTSKDDIEHQK